MNRRPTNDATNEPLRTSYERHRHPALTNHHHVCTFFSHVSGNLLNACLSIIIQCYGASALHHARSHPIRCAPLSRLIHTMCNQHVHRIKPNAAEPPEGVDKRIHTQSTRICILLQSFTRAAYTKKYTLLVYEYKCVYTHRVSLCHSGRFDTTVIMCLCK